MSKLTHTKMVRMSFWAGAASAGSVLSLYQDWFGLEGYIERVRDGWISEWVSVPIAIAALTGSLLLLGGLRSIARRLDAPRKEGRDDQAGIRG